MSCPRCRGSVLWDGLERSCLQCGYVHVTAEDRAAAAEADRVREHASARASTRAAQWLGARQRGETAA